jgi:methylase of polypeptide subunit release factors
MAKPISQLLFDEKDSLTHAADKLVGATFNIMRQAKTEEDLRIGFEKALGPLLHSINLESKPKYEKTIRAYGRTDAEHGQVIIEYEAPDAFKSTRAVQHAFDQLVDYIEGRALEQKETLWLHDPKLVGVGFDGNKIFFVQYQGDKIKAKTKLAKNDFVLLGPHQFDPQSARTFLTYIRALSRTLLTAENLSESFGPQSTIAPIVVSALVDAMLNWSQKPRVYTFFKEWQRLFGIVYGDQFVKQQTEEAKKLANLYTVSHDIKFQELLFCVHTYFVFIMKLIAAELLAIKETSFKSSFSYDLAHSNDEELSRKLAEIEDGGVFAKRGITNFLEGDFFCWYINALSPRLRDAIREMSREFSKYEPATTTINPDATKDLLKKLYQYLVPQEVRHKLGEYYTPDWLAELLIKEVGYDGNLAKRVLDPACGSGTFIVLAIKQAKEYARGQKLKPIEICKHILSNVWGFDLNPLAIIASRTNYLFALGSLVEELESFEIPVYLADSVLWRDQNAQMQLGPQGDSLEVPTSATTFFVPRIWIKNRGLLMQKAAPLIEQLVREQYTSDEAMPHIRKAGLVYPPHDHVVQEFYNQILKLEQEGRNGIWARFLKNAFAPMTAGTFDFVIGNPPWIRWGYLSQEYRNETVNLWKSYGLFSLKGHAARLGGGEKDFSMLFTYAAIDYYLKDKGLLGFLITQEVFKSKGAGEGFRRFQLGTENKSIYFKVLKAHDFASVQPFEGATNKTAAIIVRKNEKTEYPVSYSVWTRKKGIGKIPTDSTLDGAIKRLNKEKNKAKPIGKLTDSWQTLSDNDIQLTGIKGLNAYRARRGASTEPYGVYQLSVEDVYSDGSILVQNLFDNGKRKIPSVKEIIESDLVFPAVRGSDIKKWNAIPGIQLLMSQDPSKMEPYPESQMKKEWPRTYGYLVRFKDILLSRGSNTIRNLAERTAFYAMFGIGSYTVAPYKVIWKRMSNDITAAVISEYKTVYGYKKVIPTDTTALIACQKESEAHFICAILNSLIVRQFIKSYSSAGRGFGAPSVMNHLAIPQYDEKKKLHTDLVDLSKRLHSFKGKGDESEIMGLEKNVELLTEKLFS